MNNCINDLSCGFLKANSTQHAFPRLIQSFKKDLDSSGFVWTMLMDLSNAYYCLPHDPLIAKREAYCLDQPSLDFVNVYLRFHRIVTGLMLPGMFLRDPFWGLYFLIFLSMIFFWLIKKSDICKFADDHTLFSSGKNFSVILKRLEHDIKILFKML